MAVDLVFAKLLLLAVDVAVAARVAVGSDEEGEGLAVSCVFQFLVGSCIYLMMDTRNTPYHRRQHSRIEE